MSLDNEIDEILDVIYNLSNISQPRVYHAEENALQHTLQVFYIAQNNSDDHELILASLLHDIGKTVDSNNHAVIAVQMLSKYTFITEKVNWLIKNHIRIAYYLNGEMKKKSKIDKLVNNANYSILLKLRQYDVAGRDPNIHLEFNKEELKNSLRIIINNILAEQFYSANPE